MTPKELRSRWKSACGKQVLASIRELVRQRAGRDQFVTVLAGLEGTDDTEVADFVDMRGIPFGGCLHSLDLPRLDMSHAVKTKCPITQVTRISLTMCNLVGSRFVDVEGGITTTKSNVDYCDFSGTNLLDADWSFNGDMKGVVFDRANLKGGVFLNQKLTRCSFRESQLNYTSLGGVALKWCDFRDSSISNSFFKNCSFDSCAFGGAKLSNVDLPGGMAKVAGEDETAVGYTYALIDAALRICSEDSDYRFLADLLGRARVSVETDSTALVDLIESELAPTSKAKLDDLLEMAEDELNEA